MKIEFDFDKCIYCLENPADSWEHIIPESIGGRLQIRALCSDCNRNRLGSKLISKVKEDPSIRLAIRNLKKELPDLYESIENGQLYLAKGNNNAVTKQVLKNGKFIVLSEQKEDGSIIHDSKKAGEHISKMLKKEGLPEDGIFAKIESFKKLELDKMISLSNNLRAVKRETGPIEPCFTDVTGKSVGLLDERVTVLMAYEFLSLSLRSLILQEEFDFIRDFIKGGQKSQNLSVGHFLLTRYEAYHEIYPELLNDEIIINIILFGGMLYKVHFKNFPLKSPDFDYVEDLKNKRTLITESVEQAKQGNWL